MKTITYYNVNYNSFVEKDLPTVLCTNFATVELCRSAIRTYFKPNWNLNCTSLYHPYVHKLVTSKKPVYKRYKTGKCKGEHILDIYSNKIVDHYESVTVDELVKDYSKLNVTKETFYNLNLVTGWRLIPNEYDGYFELQYVGNTIMDTSESVTYSCVVQIRFVFAHLVSVPEVKVIGEPYQPGCKKIVETSKTDWYDLFVCKSDSVSRYGLEPNMDNWFKSSRAGLTDVVYISKNDLIVCDNLKELERVESNINTDTLS